MSAVKLSNSPSLKHSRGIRVPAYGLLAVLLAIQVALVVYGSAMHYPNIDEIGHLAAGVSHWKFGEFDLFRVNPPLVRSVAALPVFLSGVEFDWSGYTHTPGKRGEFAIGTRFLRDLRDRGESAEKYFFIARLACIPFAVVGTLFCHSWGRRLGGPLGGLLSASLWVFSPDVLANAQSILPEVGAMAMGIGACYCFWRWAVRPTWPKALVAGGLLGLALLSKATWIVLFAAWPIVWLIDVLAFQRRRRRIAAIRGMSQLVLILMLGLYVLNLGYFFEGTLRPLRTFDFQCNALRGTKFRLAASENRFRDSWLGRIPVPLPENYVYGIDQVKYECDRGKPSYLRGQWKHGGWWYYYLYGLAVKVPLGVWILGATGGVSLAMRRRSWAGRRALLHLFFPAVLLVAMVSSQTGFNHHIRYVLLALPALFVIAAGIPSALMTRCRPEVFALSVCAWIWFFVGSMRVFPHSHAYFNELAGGPAGGHFHLLNGNIEWGQDYSYVRRWLEAHPEARPFYFAGAHVVPGDLAGIEAGPPPSWPPPERQQHKHHTEIGPQPGWYGISVNLLHGSSERSHWGRPSEDYANDPSYSYFLHFTPIERIGYSIYIYHVTLEECNRVRALLDLPELAKSEQLGLDPDE